MNQAETDKKQEAYVLKQLGVQSSDYAFCM